LNQIKKSHNVGKKVRNALFRDRFFAMRHISNKKLTFLFRYDLSMNASVFIDIS